MVLSVLTIITIQLVTSDHSVRERIAVSDINQYFYYHTTYHAVHSELFPLNLCGSINVRHRLRRCNEIWSVQIRKFFSLYIFHKTAQLVICDKPIGMLIVFLRLRASIALFAFAYYLKKMLHFIGVSAFYIIWARVINRIWAPSKVAAN